MVIARDDGYARRVNFVLGHEFAHWNLPWHKALLYKCTQFDLSANANKQLEREANFYSSELCFMGQQFTDRLLGSELTLPHLLSLSDSFEMSRESTFRRAVELEIRPCALLSLKVNHDSEENFLTIKYCVHSEPFAKTYGVFAHKQTFPRAHTLAQIVVDPLLDMMNQYECTLMFGDEKHKMRGQVWKNKWNIFALVTPDHN